MAAFDRVFALGIGNGACDAEAAKHRAATPLHAICGSDQSLPRVLADSGFVELQARGRAGGAPAKQPLALLLKPERACDCGTSIFVAWGCSRTLKPFGSNRAHFCEEVEAI
jgi:hypothetical protein